MKYDSGSQSYHLCLQMWVTWSKLVVKAFSFACGDRYYFPIYIQPNYLRHYDWMGEIFHLEVTLSLCWWQSLNGQLRLKEITFMILAPWNNFNCTLSKRYLVCYFFISFSSQLAFIVSNWQILYDQIYLPDNYAIQLYLIKLY